MSGMKPDFLGNEVVTGYYDAPNPYKDAEPCGFNLLEMSRYAKSVGKKMCELSRAEVNRFAVTTRL